MIKHRILELFLRMLEIQRPERSYDKTERTMPWKGKVVEIKLVISSKQHPSGF